jgi:5-methylcytosine-specific restriction endonuclease McrBC regulatory subunit McrC
MSKTVGYDEGKHTFSVPERGTLTIEGCPDDMERRLVRASFERKSPNVFVKRQGSLDNGSDYKVVEVTVRENTLTVDARDIVGVVSLTPSDSLRIDPKIDWEHIFNIVLAVQDSRSSEYRGVPISDVVSDNVDLSDIFVVLGINYLEGIEEIERRGYIRDLVTTRSDLDHVRGKIDFSRTLMNRAEGSTKIHCLRKEVDYNNVANSLIHYAGKALLRLFRKHSGEYDHPAYDGIFSRIHREVERLEEMGVTSGFSRIGEYRRFSIHDLPRERHYYKRALDISKSIATSSLGQQMEEGREQIVVDYVLNMESLFEDYSQVIIEEALERIKSYDISGQTENVGSIDSKRVKPFENEGGIRHEPDHAVEDGSDVVAVLDSKYYGEGHDPVTDGSARSRLFSYAYLLESDRLAYLCPLQEERTRTVRQTGAELTVVTPESFSLEEYKEAIYEYLYGVLVEKYPLLEVFRAVEEHELCLDQTDVSDLEGLDEPGGSVEFSINNEEEFSFRAVKAAARDLSYRIRNTHDLEHEGRWTQEDLEDLCRENRQFRTVRCVPVFLKKGRNEFIRPYFITYTGEKIDVQHPEDDLRLLEKA